MKLIGPVQEILPFTNLADKGPLDDKDLSIIKEGGILIDGEKIVKVGKFSEIKKENPSEIIELTEPCVVIPGLIDTHTHICFAGSRARDYALRNAGVSYLEIAKQGGGILDTVAKTRAASLSDLKTGLSKRCDIQLNNGITTCEVKSGYGLTKADEIKMLTAIQEVNTENSIDLISSCLAAHVKPREFEGYEEYLNYIIQEILPEVAQKKLSKRVDIFVEEGAFSYDLSIPYLERAKAMGFSLVIHADQFSAGGSRLAWELHAVSADHLEASGENEMKQLAKASVIATVLPGASLGLGMNYAPARKLLDHGCSVVIASDWNPGSAPMGDLLTQAAVLGAAEKLSMAETWAGLTYRAAAALELTDRGRLASGMLADMIAFPCSDYREILYRQGQMKPVMVWKNGKLVES